MELNPFRVLKRLFQIINKREKALLNFYSQSLWKKLWIKNLINQSKLNLSQLFLPENRDLRLPLKKLCPNLERSRSSHQDQNKILTRKKQRNQVQVLIGLLIRQAQILGQAQVALLRVVIVILLQKEDNKKRKRKESKNCQLSKRNFSMRNSKNSNSNQLVRM